MEWLNTALTCSVRTTPEYGSATGDWPSAAGNAKSGACGLAWQCTHAAHVIVIRSAVPGRNRVHLMARRALETLGKSFRLQSHQQAMLIMVEGLLEHLIGAVMPAQRGPADAWRRRRSRRMFVAPGAGEGGLNAEVGVASAMLAVAAKATQGVPLNADQVLAGDQSVGVVDHVVAAVRIVLRKVAMTGDAAAVVHTVPGTMARRALGIEAGVGGEQFAGLIAAAGNNKEGDQRQRRVARQQ